VSFLRWPENALRSALIVGFALLMAGVYGAARLWICRLRDAPRRRSVLARLRGRLLRFSMAWLGATFIKMGQVMSTRPDLFDPEFIEELRALQDRVPAFAFWRVRRTIASELGRPIEEVFAEFDRKAVAAASVAQVHRAVLHDGTEVAVKVLRPNVRRRVERDATILMALSRIVALHPTLRLSDPVGHLRHFVQAIIDQTDLLIERDNYRRFHHNFAKVEGIRFPAVHESYCTRRVLTMEFIRGIKLDALPQKAYPVLAANVRQMMFQMCFHDGFLHCDLHPGNMLVVDERDLVILDVGLAKLLHEDVLIQFIDFTKCLTMGTAEDLVDHLKRFHTYLGDVDWDSLRVDVHEFGSEFRAKDARALEYSQLLGGIVGIARKYRVRPILDLALVFVALVTSQGLGKRLNPGENVFDQVAMFLRPILRRRGERVPGEPTPGAADDSAGQQAAKPAAAERARQQPVSVAVAPGGPSPEAIPPGPIDR
jgi:ubiquinone biosynthesis protein